MPGVGHRQFCAGDVVTILAPDSFLSGRTATYEWARTGRVAGPAPCAVHIPGLGRHWFARDELRVEECQPRTACECNGGNACACPDCGHPDCCYRVEDDLDHILFRAQDAIDRENHAAFPR